MNPGHRHGIPRYIFGDDIRPHTQHVNRVFGGARPKGTRIFFTDFSDDPWSETTVDDECMRLWAFNFLFDSQRPKKNGLLEMRYGIWCRVICVYLCLSDDSWSETTVDDECASICLFYVIITEIISLTTNGIYGIWCRIICIYFCLSDRHVERDHCGAPLYKHLFFIFFLQRYTA